MDIMPMLIIAVVILALLFVCFIGRNGTKTKAPTNSGQSYQVLISTLKNAGIQYIDNRHKGGAFWIIGGKELEWVVKMAAVHGIEFHFKKNGGRTTTKGKDSWWAKF